MYIYVASAELDKTMDETCALKFINENEDYLQKMINGANGLDVGFRRNGNKYQNYFEPYSLYLWKRGNQIVSLLPDINENRTNSPDEIKKLVKSYAPSQRTEDTETEDVYNAYLSYLKRSGDDRVPVIYSIGQGKFDPIKFKGLIGEEAEKIEGLPGYVFGDVAAKDIVAIVIVVDARPGERILGHIESVAKYHCGEIKSGDNT